MICGFPYPASRLALLLAPAIAMTPLGLAAQAPDSLRQDTVYELEGIRAEYEPTLAGGVGATMPLIAGIEAAGELRCRGEQFCAAPSPGIEEFRALGPSARADLQLARSFPLGRAAATLDRLDLELAVDNVTDSAVYDQCGLPRPGRTFRLQVRLN